MTSQTAKQNEMTQNDIMHYLQPLSEAVGVSGLEDEVRSVVLDAIDGHAEQIRIDPMGNITALKTGTGPEPRLTLMIDAHMDEVGFMVTGFDSEGLIRFSSVGGIDDRILPGLRVLVPAATPACGDAIRALLAAAPLPEGSVRLFEGRAREAITAADVVLLASGTATLETMLAKRPMVVGYRIAPSTHRIVRALGLLKVDRYALPNVLAGQTIAPELMQDDCTPEALAAAVLQWFSDPAAVAALEPVYRDLHLTLRRDASASAADAVSELLDMPR